MNSCSRNHAEDAAADVLNSRAVDVSYPVTVTPVCGVESAVCEDSDIGAELNGRVGAAALVSEQHSVVLADAEHFVFGTVICPFAVRENAGADRPEHFASVGIKVVQVAHPCEGVCTDHLNAGAEGDVIHVPCPVADIGADLLDAVREVDAVETVAVIESVVADGDQRGGKIDALEIIAVFEEVAADLIDGVRHGEVLDVLCAAFRVIDESVVIDCDNRLAVDRRRDVDGLQVLIVAALGNCIAGDIHLILPVAAVDIAAVSRSGECGILDDAERRRKCSACHHGSGADCSNNLSVDGFHVYFSLFS